MSVPPKPDIPGKTCKVCGAPLTRKRYPNSMESYGAYLAREHCSQSCANSRAEVGRSGHHWRARKHLKDACENCAATEDLHVHHQDRDSSNDDPSNLQTLCDSCHLKLHWREDRDKRLASNSMLANAQPPKACVICQASFSPRHRRTQTCSPQCKAALLSLRTTEHYAGHRIQGEDGLFRLEPPRPVRAPIPLSLRVAVYERDGWHCVGCGSTDDLTLDHVHPWSLGGIDAEDNLQTLCRPCNSRKGVRA